MKEDRDFLGKEPVGKLLLKLALPTVVAQLINMLYNIVDRIYIGHIPKIGEAALTGVGVCMPLQGLGQGAQPIISYNYGAGNPERVRGAFRLLLKASLVYSTLLWAFVMLFPQGFAAMFTNSGTLIDFTKTALRIYMACLLLFGIQVSCQMTFTALGNAKASILVAVMRKFILLIPLIYIMPLIFPADRTTAVYMAEPVADFIAVSFTAIFFSFQFRKSLRQLSGRITKK